MNYVEIGADNGSQLETEDYSYLELLGRVKAALDAAVEVVVPVEEIRRYPQQPREDFNEEGLRRLSAAIDAGGQTTWGLIREKPGETRYELIDGERRWRAIYMIPAERRPLYKANLIVADDDVIQFLISGTANFNREGHKSLEITKTIDRLVGFKIPMKEIAVLLGISEMWAHQMHGLRRLVPEVQAMLDPKLPKDKLLPITAAVQISKIEGPFQESLARRVLSRDISLGRLRSEVVKVAKREGSHLRVHEVSPLKQWESFGNKLEVILRTATDAKALVDKGDIKLLLVNRPNDTAKLLKRIRDAKKQLDALDGLVDRMLE